MEWEGVGIVLSSAPFGEADAVVTLLTNAHGAHRGLARGARSRRPSRSIWELGNILCVTWTSRVADQLGSFNAEMLEAPSSELFDAPLQMAILASACAVGAGALWERAPHPRTYDGLVDLLARLTKGGAGVPALIRWEMTLLGELGYGLDLSRCAVSGQTDELTFVSPRSGCAVSAAVAAPWRDKLLRLPPFLIETDEDSNSTVTDWVDGLKLSGHFLQRDVFGQRHQPIPAARHRLADMVTRLEDSPGNMS